MHFRATVLLLPVLLFGGVRNAKASDCDAILAGGIFDTSLSLSSTDFRSAFRNYFCSHATRSTGGSGAGGLELDLPGGFKLGGNLSNSKENNELNDMCSAAGSSQSLSTTTLTQIHSASDIIVRGFNDCINQIGLRSALLYSPVSNIFNVALSYRGFGTQPNFVTIDSVEPTNAECNVKPGTKITNPPSYYSCRRLNEYDGSSVIVHVSGGVSTPPINISAIEKPWQPRNVSGFIQTYEPGKEKIYVSQSNTNVQWTLLTHDLSGRPIFDHHLSGIFTSESHLIGTETRRDVSNGCTVLISVELNVRENRTADVLMKLAPTEEQPRGTVQPDGKFCDLAPTWSANGPVTIQ